MRVLGSQLLADHGGDAERPGAGQVFAQELVEQAAEDVALVAVEQGAGLERLPHLLAQEREEHRLEAPGDLFHAPRVAVAAG
jgi:hypothetical protein